MGFSDYRKGRAGVDLEALTTLTADDILTLSGGITVNASGENVDFRVESQTNTHALFVDSSTSRVGINSSNPGADLEIKAEHPKLLFQTSDASGDSQILFKSLDGTQLVNIRCDATSNALNHLGISAGTGEDHLVVHSSGNVGIGTISPGTLLTIEGAVTLKEQAAADADVAAYGQLWVKTATPNELYFTNDAGNDVQLTSGSAMMGIPADDITVGDSAVSVATSSGNVTVDSNAGSVLVDGHTGVQVISSSSGEVDITSAANIDINATTGIAVDATTVSIDGTDDSNLTVTGSAKDLDIAVAGGGTQELRLASAGTGASALHLNASAGSVDIDSADAITVDAADEIVITTGSADGHISLVSAHTAGVAFHIDANADADSEVQIDAGILDIDVTAAATIDAVGIALGAGSGELDLTTTGALDVNAAGITIDGTTLSIDGTDDSNLTVTGSAKDLDIAVAGGGTQELRLASAGTGSAAIHLNASAGGIDIDSADMIDIDAADEITIDTTSADGHIAITSAHTAGDSILISANANAGSILDIDAGIMDIDVQAAATIDAVGIALGAGSGELDLTTTGTLDVNANALDMDLTDSSTITITSSEAAEDLTIEQVGANDSSIIIQAAGTGSDAIKLNASAGSIDIDSADNITVDAADEITLTTGSADGHITLFSAHTAGVAFHIDADADAGSIVDIDAGILDIDVTAGITIDGTTLSIDGTDDSNLTVTASGKDLDIAVAGGGTQELRLASAGTGAAAIHLNASAGGIDIDSADMIDIDAADEITITTTSADGHISLVSAHTAGVAFHIDADANAGSIVDIDAGILDIDVTGAATIDAASLDITSDAVTFTSANAADPLLVIKNTTNDAAGARLRLEKDRGANNGSDGDDCGIIEFYATDDTSVQTEFARITGEVATASNSAEGGKLTISVASHDGEIQPGLIITDGSAEDEVDVTLGNGDGSLTTIVGDLKLAHDNANIQFGADGDVFISHAHNTGLTVSLGSNTTAKPIFHLKNTGDLASGPGLRFVADNGAGEGDDDVIGFIDFKGDDSVDAETVYAKMSAIASDVTDGDEGGKLKFEVFAGGIAGTAASTEVLSLGGEDQANGTNCEVVVNEGAAAFVDFRVESDSNTHMLFVDAGNNQVGINVSDPDAALEVLQGSGNQLKLSFDGTDNTTFSVDTNGYMTVTPSGGFAGVAGQLGHRRYLKSTMANGNTLGAAESGTLVLQSTASDTPSDVVLNLPATAAGLMYSFQFIGTPSHGFQISPVAADKIMGSVVNAAGGITTAATGGGGADNKDLILGAGNNSTIGNRVTLVADGSVGWHILDGYGDWTFES